MGKGESRWDSADVHYDIFPYSCGSWVIYPLDGSLISRYVESKFLRWYQKMVGSHWPYNRWSCSGRRVGLQWGDRRCHNSQRKEIPWLYSKFSCIHYVGSGTYVQCSNQWLAGCGKTDHIRRSSAKDKRIYNEASSQIHRRQSAYWCYSLYNIFPSVHIDFRWTCKRKICRLVRIFSISKSIYFGTVWTGSWI